MQIPHEVMFNYWPLPNGMMPTDFPSCGYDGSLCDPTMYFIIAGLTILTILLVTSGYGLYKIQYVSFVQNSIIPSNLHFQ